MVREGEKRKGRAGEKKKQGQRQKIRRGERKREDGTWLEEKEDNLYSTVST